MTTWHYEGFGDIGEEILHRLVGRLSDEDRRFLAEYLWEEEGLFADMLVGDLVRRHIPVNGDERELIVRLLAYFRVPGIDPDVYRYIDDRENAIAALNVVEEP